VDFVHERGEIEVDTKGAGISAPLIVAENRSIDFHIHRTEMNRFVCLWLWLLWEISPKISL
jgi:hypothetical protein